jgi:hypothetical protein
MIRHNRFLCGWSNPTAAHKSCRFQLVYFMHVTLYLLSSLAYYRGAWFPKMFSV